MIGSPNPTPITGNSNPAPDSNNSIQLEVLVADTPTSAIPSNVPWRMRLRWNAGTLTLSDFGNGKITAFLESVDGHFEEAVTTSLLAIEPNYDFDSGESYQAEIEAMTSAPPGTYKFLAVIKAESGPFSASTAEMTVQVFDDGYVNDAYARRSAIIDKKYRSGLSAKEQMELWRIDSFLDAYEAPFYEPAKRMLQAVHDQLAARQQNLASQTLSKGK